MKLADNGSILEYITDLKAQLDLKSPVSHRHARVNGLKVVVSDTPPTDNDESVITLIVNTADVPSVGMTVQFTGYITKLMAYSILNIPEYHYTVQAYIDGEPVAAQYQIEYVNSGDVAIPFSFNNTFDTVVGRGLQLRVRYMDYEETFPLAIVDPNQELKLSRIAKRDTSGVYQNGTKVSRTISYAEASEGFRVVYAFKDGYDGSDFSTMSVERVVDDAQSLTSIVTLDDLIEALETVAVGNATIETTGAFIDIDDEFTEDDIAIGAIYLFRTMASDGVIYYALELESIKDVPSTENFSGHFTRYALNESYRSGIQETDNQTTVSTSSVGEYVYFHFELDREFAYDIEIRLVDTSDTYIRNSTRVPFNSSGGTLTDPVVIPAGTTTKYVTAYHKISSAGTYYIVAEATGVDTEYEQLLSIELTVA